MSESVHAAHEFYADIKITPSAHRKIHELLGQEEAGMCFRAQIVGGGCQGLRYEFSLDLKTEEDYYADQKDFILVSDAVSYPFLEGSSIGYEVSTDGELFTVINPKEKSRCSCGSSFS